MSQKPETRGFKGGFIPAEMKSTGLNNGRDHQRGEKVYQTQDGTKDHPQKKGNASSADVDTSGEQDAREVIAQKKAE